ncbi:MAG: helix-turn-helix domain-containing protein [Paracoccaceae bacterium]
MGLHAFETEPEHCRRYREAGVAGLPPLYGARERWNMPTARHRRRLGERALFRGVDHFVLTFHAAGASVRCFEPDRAGHVARPRAITLHHPGEDADIGSDGEVEYWHLYFRPGLVEEVRAARREATPIPERGFFAAQDETLAHDLTAYLRRARDTREPPTAMEMDGRAYLIGLGLLRLCERRGAPIRLLEASERPDLRRVAELVEDRIADPLRLGDLAAVVGMTPFHFSRVFRAATGESPRAYLERRRTERAVELIRASTLPLAEIAYRTGFSSQSHMTRRVKAATGLTPGRLRRG